MKNQLEKCANFLNQKFWVLVILVLGGVYFFQTDRPPNFSHKESYQMDMGTPEPMMMSKSRAISADVMPRVSSGFAPNTDSRIIQSASLSLEVESTVDAMTLVRVEMESFEAVVQNENSWQVTPGNLAYNLLIRVPSENLDNLISNLEKIGQKRSGSKQSTDITKIYNDTENQLKTLEARRDRLRDMMKEKTDNLSDVLAIDQELARVQTQIENLSQQQANRETDTDFATLRLTIEPTPNFENFENTHWSLEQNIEKTTKMFRDSFQRLIEIFFAIAGKLPLWGPALIGLFILKKILQRSVGKQ